VIGVAVADAPVIETAVAVRAPTHSLSHKREREWTRFGAAVLNYKTSILGAGWDTSGLSARRVGHPLPLAGEGWGGGRAASEVTMDEDKTPEWKVSAKLRSNARALRRNSTDAERILWSELRDHRLNEASFRRQVPIGSYIADFLCHAAKLVIELDGGQHFSDQQETADARRSTTIEAQGFQVLRFSNHDVMTNRAGVLETIAAAVVERAPTLTLPRKRERGQELSAGKTKA
jgi:very-short-patch-repair endonuclease